MELLSACNGAQDLGAPGSRHRFDFRIFATAKRSLGLETTASPEAWSSTDAPPNCMRADALPVFLLLREDAAATHAHGRIRLIMATWLLVLVLCVDDGR